MIVRIELSIWERVAVLTCIHSITSLAKTGYRTSIFLTTRPLPYPQHLQHYIRYNNLPNIWRYEIHRYGKDKKLPD